MAPPDDPPDEVVTGPAGPHLLDEVHAALARLWASHPSVPALDRTLVDTAVAEIAANVITAAAARPPVQVSVALRVGPGRVVVDLVDDGAPLPPGTLDGGPMPGPDAESGRGLPLARAALHELRCERQDGANRWHLVRRLDPPH